MKKFVRNEDAFTGLEAAIVLIAFVVVAAVFSYVVLGAGFFTTQKSQQVVHSGVTQAASNIVVKGEVYGIASSGASSLNYIRFDIGLAAGGIPVDAEQITMTMSTSQAVDTLDYDNAGTATPGAGEWSIAERHGNQATNDYLLQPDESFTIYVAPPSDITLATRTQFNIELKPETGASLGIQRTIPAGIEPVTLLY
jgi:flagellin FlaB